MCAEDLSAPLYKASSGGHIEAVQVLLQRKADPNNKEESTLHIATRWDNVAIVRLLIENQADVNAVEGDTGTALHRAAEWNCVESAKILLEHKADLSLSTHPNIAGDGVGLW